MTLEADIVEALRTSYAMHQTNLAEIAKLRTEAAGLKAAVVSLETKIAELEADAVNVVEPAATQPAIDELMRAVGETMAALREVSHRALHGGEGMHEGAQAPGDEEPRNMAAVATLEEAGPSPAEEQADAIQHPRSSARGWDVTAALSPQPPVPASIVARREPSSRLSRFGFRLN